MLHSGLPYYYIDEERKKNVYNVDLAQPSSPLPVTPDRGFSITIPKLLNPGVNDIKPLLLNLLLNKLKCLYLVKVYRLV